GGFESAAGVTCREAGPHLKYVREHFSTAPVTEPELVTLGDQIETVSGLLSPDGPVARLTRTLSAVDHQLRAAVTEARARAEQAETEARDATGRAEADARLRHLAEQTAAEELAARHRADRERDEAVDHRRAADDARTRAANAQA